MPIKKKACIVDIKKKMPIKKKACIVDIKKKSGKNT
jgi:hypothetical protein